MLHTSLFTSVHLQVIFTLIFPCWFKYHVLYFTSYIITQQNNEKKMFTRLTFIILTLRRFHFTLFTTVTMVLKNINKFVIISLSLITHDVDFLKYLATRSQLTCWGQWRHIAEQIYCNKRVIDPAILISDHEQHTILQSLQWWKLQKLAENNGESLHTEEPH